MFDEIYNLLNTYLFSSSIYASPEYTKLVLTLLSSCACILLVSLPFVLVFFVVRRLFI